MRTDCLTVAVDGEASVESDIEPPCLKRHTIVSILGDGASRKDLTEAAIHLVGLPSSRPCGLCLERIKNRFLAQADRSDPEVAAAIAVQDGALRKSPDFFFEILDFKDVKVNEASEAMALILASFHLRFEPDSPRFLSYALLSLDKADTEADPFIQAIAHSWLARVWSIRGEFYKASHEINQATAAIKGLSGVRQALAKAFLLHQSADRYWRLRDFEKAERLLGRAIGLYRQLGLSMAQVVELSLARTFSESGQFAAARELLDRILASSRDQLLVTSALRLLVDDVLPNLAREGNAGLAERALCLRAVLGEDKRPEKVIRARNLWGSGRLAWALGTRETAFAFYREASELFLSLGSGAGLYEDGLVKLDMIEALQEDGTPQELREIAQQTAETFRALGAENLKWLATRLAQQFQTRSEAITWTEAARGFLRLAEKRRLLRTARKEQASPDEIQSNLSDW